MEAQYSGKLKFEIYSDFGNAPCVLLYLYVYTHVLNCDIKYFKYKYLFIKYIIWQNFI